MSQWNSTGLNLCVMKQGQDDPESQFYWFNDKSTHKRTWCRELVSHRPATFFFLKIRGGEWYLEKCGSQKILAGSRNLGSVFDKSRSLVFAWFVFTVFESRNILPKSLGLGFLTSISASRRSRILPFATHKIVLCTFKWCIMLHNLSPL